MISDMIPDIKATTHLSLVIATLLLLGCSDDNSGSFSSSSNGTAINQSAEEVRAEVVASSGIDLVPLSFLDWDLQMSNIAGQIVVMDFWAMWCIPCIERFPHMVELSNHYPEDKVRFVSVNIDDFTDEDAYISALDFLNAVGADFENYQMQEEMFDTFEFFGLESIPAVIVYNTAGGQHVRLSGYRPEDQFTEADIVANIEELLATPLQEI